MKSSRTSPNKTSIWWDSLNLRSSKTSSISERFKRMRLRIRDHYCPTTKTLEIGCKRFRRITHKRSRRRLRKWSSFDTNSLWAKTSSKSYKASTSRWMRIRPCNRRRCSNQLAIKMRFLSWHKTLETCNRRILRWNSSWILRGSKLMVARNKSSLFPSRWKISSSSSRPLTMTKILSKLNYSKEVTKNPCRRLNSKKRSRNYKSKTRRFKIKILRCRGHLWRSRVT